MDLDDTQSARTQLLRLFPEIMSRLLCCEQIHVNVSLLFPEYPV